VVRCLDEATEKVSRLVILRMHAGKDESAQMLECAAMTLVLFSSASFPLLGILGTSPPDVMDNKKKLGADLDHQ
jgi:hypothetical protein